MRVPLSELRQMVTRCDPGAPLAVGDPAYYALDEGVPVRGSEGRSCIDALIATIDLDERGDTRQLFTGFPGCGKTTELLRLVDRLRASSEPTHVIYLDVEREYVNPYATLEPSDLLRVLTFALDLEAETVAKESWPRSGYARRLRDYLGSVDGTQGAALPDLDDRALMRELGTSGALRERLSAALATRLSSFAEESRAVAEAAVGKIREATGATRVVLVVDGLEKVLAAREEDRSRIERSLETTFIDHAELLRFGCHLVLTCPMWLRYRTSQLGGLWSAEPAVLPMVKVKNPDGSPYEPGLTKLAELVARRLDLARVFGDATAQSETLRHLLEASGGYPRDLLRMLREALRRSDLELPIPRRVVDQVITGLSEEYRLGLREAHLDVLREIAQTHVFPRGDDARVELFGQLLDRWFLLAYRNGVPELPEWYDLHPLVARTKLMREALATP